MNSQRVSLNLRHDNYRLANAPRGAANAAPFFMRFFVITVLFVKLVVALTSYVADAKNIELLIRRSALLRQYYNSLIRHKY